MLNAARPSFALPTPSELSEYDAAFEATLLAAAVLARVHGELVVLDRRQVEELRRAVARAAHDGRGESVSRLRNR